MVLGSRRIHSFFSAFPSSFWVLFAGTLIWRAGDFIMPFLSLYLTEQRRFSVQDAGLVVSALGLGQFFAQWFGGILYDRIGARPTMLLALTSSAVFAFLMSQVSSGPLLFLCVFGFGLLLKIYGPASKAAVAAMLSGAARVQAYNLLYWAINVGTVFAPLIGGALSSANYNLLFYANSGVLLLFAGLVYTRFKEPQEVQEKPRGSRITVLPRDGLLYLYAGLGVLFSVVWLQGYSTLSLALKAQGFSGTDYGMVFSLNGLVVVLVGLPLGRLIVRYPPSLVLAGSSLLIAAGMGLHAVSSTLPMHALAVGIWTLGEIVEFTILSSVIAALAPPNLRGTYQGISGAAMGLGGALAPLIGTYGLTHWGVGRLYAAVALLSLLIALFQFLLRPTLERRIGKSLELG